MDSQALTIRPVSWSDDAAAALAEAMPSADVEDIRQNPAGGECLFEVMAETGRVGFYLLRVERSAQGCEGVVVAGAGHWKGLDLIAVVVPAIERQFIGCKTIRIHTARPGLARKLSRMGYGAGEIILRKTLE